MQGVAGRRVMRRKEKNFARDGVLRKGLRRLGLWRWRGRKMIKNPVQTTSQPGPEEVRKGPGGCGGFGFELPRSREAGHGVCGRTGAGPLSLRHRAKKRRHQG